MPDLNGRRSYSARDVQRVAGLTRRQLNDWDSRGALPHERSGDGGWRRFSRRELFVLAVCSEIRRRFGTPVERLKFVQEFMLQEGADHFQAAVWLIDLLGVAVWLLTDLESTFIMDSELEFVDLWHLRYFGVKQEDAFVFLPINPIVKRVVATLDDPVKLEAHGLGYELLAERQVRTREEALVLEHIRSGGFAKVEVEAPNGRIVTIRTTSRPNPAAEPSAQLEDLKALLEEPYQRLVLTKKDGRVVSIVQEVTSKPEKEAP